MDEMTEEEGTFSTNYTVEVPGGKSSIAVSIMRVIPAICLLILSLISYLIGIILTLTIIGAIAGIPIIIGTYAADAVALMVLINMRERLYRVTCPGCEKKRWIMPAVRERFLCKGCEGIVDVVRRDK